MDKYEDLRTAHNHSRKNRENIMLSEKCGCFYCQKTFSSSDIRTWWSDGTRACCPICGIDAVLPSNVCRIDQEFLQRMNEFWFKRGIKVTMAELQGLKRDNTESSPKKNGDAQ